jgi:hypothetical protein
VSALESAIFSASAVKNPCGRIVCRFPRPSSLRFVLMSWRSLNSFSTRLTLDKSRWRYSRPTGLIRRSLQCSWSLQRALLNMSNSSPSRFVVQNRDSWQKWIGQAALSRTLRRQPATWRLVQSLPRRRSTAVVRYVEGELPTFRPLPIPSHKSIDHHSCAFRSDVWMPKPCRGARFAQETFPRCGVGRDLSIDNL